MANISHDLRTPLTMIRGYAELMRDIPGEANDENIQIIIDETNRLSNLVTDILDLSKLQSGVEKLNKIDFSITDSINICCKFCLFISCNIFFNKLQKRNNRPIKIIIKNTTVVIIS